MIDSRLPQQSGEWIDRGRPIGFSFEGRHYTGFEGDTVSTALWANGVRVIGRSFKYHRPRGIFSLNDSDSSLMMESGDRTNIRADLTQISEGLELNAVNTWGGVRRDLLKVLDHFGAFTPVGFYYKAFHKPRSLFPFYENRLREIAGLGRVTPSAGHAHSPKDYAFCDVLVIGSGPSGMSAALEAAERGAEILLVEKDPRLGGSLTIDGVDPQVVTSWLSQIEAAGNIEVRTATTAVGYYADHWVALVDDRRLTKVRARSVIMTTGCTEQPAVFRNNDLPGVMFGSAARSLIHRYAVRPFSRGVVLTANSDGYSVALDLHQAGVAVEAVVDLRPEGEGSAIADQVAEAGMPVHLGHAITEARPIRGKRGVRDVTICPLDSKGRLDLQNGIRIPCDGIAVSVGWAPADNLLRQGRARMAYEESLEQFVPNTLPSGLFAAGRVNGIYPLEGRLDARFQDGQRAGALACEHIGAGEASVASGPERTGPSRSHPYPVFSHPKGKNFVDLDEDVQLKDLENAMQEGFDNIELLKRYSTFGMGPSQGKHANLLALRILSRHRSEDLKDKELTTARPFFTPVSLGHLAGRSFTPVARTPNHSRHEELNAVFMYAGNWLRPEHYPREGLTREQVIQEEAVHVRKSVGLIDLGTLGKLEVWGPDAAKFLERIYTCRFAKLGVGRTRYGVACDETGVVIDDGVIVRLAEDHFYVSTTSSGSAGVFRELQRWRLEWGLDVVLVNATHQYGALNLAGPLSRALLQTLTDTDLGNEAFPYLAARTAQVAGVSALLSRVGFVGELGYELHVPAAGAPTVWDALMERGADFGIRPFGVEAQRLLRLEKGHLIIGQDTDGLTDPFEADLSWAVKMDKRFFVGQRSLAILQRKDPKRGLVGFTLPTDHRGETPKECHLVIQGDEIAGRVTSVSYSPALRRIIGLAYVRPDQQEPGTRIQIRSSSGRFVEATVTPIPFYDPENARQNVGAAASVKAS
jgi:sarcosine oxidase subunit alpha